MTYLLIVLYLTIIGFNFFWVDIRDSELAPVISYSVCGIMFSIFGIFKPHFWIIISGLWFILFLLISVYITLLLIDKAHRERKINLVLSLLTTIVLLAKLISLC